MISRLKKNQRILLSGALVLLGCVLLIVSIVSFDAEYELGDSFLMVCSRFGVLAVCVVLAIIVMHDAMGVRREAGRHAKAINELLETLSSQQEPDVKLKEFLGHTPMQVCCGAVLGFAVAWILG